MGPHFVDDYWYLRSNYWYSRKSMLQDRQGADRVGWICFPEILLLQVLDRDSKRGRAGLLGAIMASIKWSSCGH
jgi:hypothetical protein